MATVETNALIQAMDADGNVHLVYPITKKENIADLEEATQTESGLMCPDDKKKLDNLGNFSIGIDETGIYFSGTSADTGYVVDVDTEGIFITEKGG